VQSLLEIYTIKTVEAFFQRPQIKIF